MKLKTNISWLIVCTALFIVVLTSGCKKDKYVEIEGVCPVVLTTNPSDQTTGVPLGQVITATFNEAMDPSTITPSSFELRGAAEVSGTLSYNETNATISFVPDAKLSANTTYTATVFAVVRDLMGSALQTDYIWTFSTGDSLSPMVISTDPANNANGVPRNKVIEANFNMPMDPLTINTSTFTLKQGPNTVNGTVLYNGTKASFTPGTNLAYNTLYTATITTAARNTLGTSMANNHVWTFRTSDSLTPFIISTDPANGASGVPQNKIVMATFNLPMDPATINSTTFTLKEGINIVTGIVSYNGTSAVFTPSVPLIAGGLFTATITTGAESANGVALTSDYVWTFRTLNAVAPQVLSTDPGNNASGVVLNKVVKADFTMQMDPLTINPLTFTLKQGTTVIPGSVSYTGTTASFTPTNPLQYNTLYTATITTGAKNLSGTPLAADYVWSFRTMLSAGVDLKSVMRFGIIAGVGVSNNAGFSEIHNMDVGISPGVRSSITGFPPAIIINGAIYASDDIAPPGVAAMLTQAKQDLTDAYLFAEGASFPAPITVSGDMGGLTLTPGIYKSTSTLMVQSGNLTLDAQGDPNAVWIFQIASDLTTVGGAGGSIILSGGAQAKNIFWQSGSSVTIGDNTVFKGNVMVLTSITLNSGAVAEGRMLARNGSVVMTNTNIITKP